MQHRAKRYVLCALIGLSSGACARSVSRDGLAPFEVEAGSDAGPTTPTKAPSPIPPVPMTPNVGADDDAPEAYRDGGAAEAPPVALPPATGNGGGLTGVPNDSGTGLPMGLPPGGFPTSGLPTSGLPTGGLPIPGLPTGGLPAGGLGGLLGGAGLPIPIPGLGGTSADAGTP